MSQTKTGHVVAIKPRRKPDRVEVGVAAHRCRDLAVALVATGLTLWYSLGPTPPSDGSDKELHAAAYFVDAFTILLAVVWRPGRETRRLKGGDAAGRPRAAHRGRLIEIEQGGMVDRATQFGDWV